MEVEEHNIRVHDKKDTSTSPMPSKPSASDGNPNPENPAPKQLDEKNIEEMWGPLAPGSGGKAGELADPETIENLALWDGIKKEKVEAAKQASAFRFDESQIENFCANVIKETKIDFANSFRTPTKEIDRPLDPSKIEEALFNTPNGVIAFDKWSASDKSNARNKNDEKKTKIATSKILQASKGIRQ